MSVIDTIVDEHHLIRKYIDTVGIAAELMGEGLQVPRDFFQKVIDFSKTYLDKYHHFKEEYVIFLKLAEKKGGQIDAQIVTLRDQHERGRNFISQISKSLDAYEQGKEDQHAKIAENLGYFYQLQKQHISRENHSILPLARESFSDTELKEFEETFAKEKERLGEKIAENSEKLIAEMDKLLSSNFPDAYQLQRDMLEQNRAHQPE